jgi:predicted amidohydrolase
MRVAAFQRFPIFDDPGAVADRLVADLEWADRAGVELALFPEAYLLGHSYDPEVIERRSISTDGDLWKGLLSRLEPFRAAAVVGAFERHHDHLTNSAFVIEAGRVTGRYAKAHPNEPGIVAGTDFPVFARSGTAFGINICNDANHPTAASRLADRGARLICYPLNNVMRPAVADSWRTLSVANLTSRARETGCWIMSADVTGTVGDRLSHGCTMIVSPDGAIVARAAEGAEGAAVYDLPPMP